MSVSRIKASTFILLLCLGACDCGDPDGPPDGFVPDGPFNPNCGNSALDTGETCDDANNVGNDGCSALCIIEAGYTCPDLGQACIGCGDDIIQAGEQCDDGDNAPDDGCSATCQREPGWDCIGEECTPSTCGDGIRVGPEDCDDGNKVSGDGCSIRCDIEAGYVCVTPNFPCRLAVCGDSAVEAQEECDSPAPGCIGCVLQDGYDCPTPGQACVGIVCGDGVVQGNEECDDASNAAPGCTMCELDDGYNCPTPGQACVMNVCGNGVREGNEGCDDDDTDAGDGCSATCTVEGFYECEGALSVCKKPIEFVRIARFAAPMPQPQALHYDPRTRSFVAYDFTGDPDAEVDGDAQEFCLDGSKPPDTVRDASLEARRELVGDSLDGAAYDPFRDRFLFVRQNGQIYEIDRNNNITAGINAFQLNDLGTAGGVQVGDDGRIYATSHYYRPGGTGPRGRVLAFTRTMTGTVNATSGVTDTQFRPVTRVPDGTYNPYLDNIFNIPGVRWIGYYNLPDPALADPDEQVFMFHRYDGTFIGSSRIPGILFRNGETFPANADGGEAATDGGYFLVCSEYLNQPTTGSGICQLFAQTCSTTADCTERVPGTICKLDETIPYCYAPAVARDDRYTIAAGSPLTALDVLLNDAFADAVCSGAAPMITAVTAGNHGGTVAINGPGTRVNYTPMAGCGFVETFTYTANLGGGLMDTATVTVTVPCNCGDGIVDPGEECDGAAGTPPGRTCRAPGQPGQCTLAGVCGNGGDPEPGEQCDDGNMVPGDGCSPTCTVEIN